MRVVIADDSVLWREGLARLLAEACVEVCALVGDADSLVGAVAEHQPDVAVVDVRMPPTFTTKAVRSQDGCVSNGRRWGSPCCPKHSKCDTLRRWHVPTPTASGISSRTASSTCPRSWTGSTTLVAGGTVLDPDVVGALLGRRQAQDRLGRLSPREREVLGLIAEGRSNAAMRELVLTEKTVESHIASVLTKLDLPQTPDDHRRVLAVLAWLEA